MTRSLGTTLGQPTAVSANVQRTRLGLGRVRRSLISVQLLLAAALVTALLPGQVAEKANQGYQTEEQRARVARKLDNPDRVERQKPAELLEALKITEGDIVADIGTGVGFMLPYLVDAVGPGGTVWAEDIQDDFLSQVKEKIKANGWSNVKTVKGAQKDVNLPAGSLDLAFILDVYHHLNYPEETMTTVHKAVKPGGRLIVIDFYRSREHPRMSKERRLNHIRLDRDGFASEIEAVGFRLERHFDHLPHQYALVFRKDG